MNLRTAQLNDDLAAVVGRRRADKVSEIGLTAIGHSEGEKCVCCPCMPASQVLFFLITAFLFYNVYRLETGIEYDSRCTGGRNTSSVVAVVVPPEGNGTNSDNEESYLWPISYDEQTNSTTYLGTYTVE